MSEAPENVNEAELTTRLTVADWTQSTRTDSHVIWAKFGSL